jgi:hypothetical protein
MATVASDLIIARLTELLDNAAGGRPIPLARLTGDLQPSLPVTEQVRRALSSARYSVSIDSLDRTEASDLGRIIYKLSVSVRIVRSLTVLDALDDATRDAAIGAASDDVDFLAQCFCFENNATASQTGVVSGKLEHVSFETTVELSSESPSHVTSIHTFEGWVVVAPEERLYYLLDPITEANAIVYNSPITGNVMSGSTTMTWCVVFHQETPAPANYGNVVMLMRGALGGGVGQKHGVFTNNGAIYFRIYDASGTLYGAPTPTLGSSYNGQMVTLCWTYNSPTLRTFVNGVQYGADTNTTGGITAIADGVYGGSDICVGLNGDGLFNSGGNRNDSLWYMGIALSHSTALSVAQVASWHESVKRTGAVSSYPGVQYLLDMRHNTTLPATWTDSVAGIAWTKQRVGTVQSPSTVRWSG